MSRSSILRPDGAVLLVVDLQERFRGAVRRFEEVVARSVRLVRTFRILDIPVLATEQYPKGLGPTVPEVREALASPTPAEAKAIEKTAFSACGAPGLVELLPRGGTIVVCGIEAHVCVSQSVHDLLDLGFQVHVAVDAVGSRRESDRDVALRRMELHGAILTSSEAAAFELLRDARNPRFKEVQALFK